MSKSVTCPEPDRAEKEQVLDLLRHYHVRTAGQAITRIEAWITAAATIPEGNLIAGLGDNEPGLAEELQAELALVRQHAELRRDLEAEFAEYEAERTTQGLCSDFDEFENEATMGATYESLLEGYEFEPERLVRSAAPPNASYSPEALGAYAEHPIDSGRGHLFGLLGDEWIPCRHMDQVFAEEVRQEQQKEREVIAEEQERRLQARMQHYVALKMPLVQAELERQVAAGQHIAELVGLICDGEADMTEIGVRATIIPVRVARQMIGTASNIAEFAEAVRLLTEPEPGKLLVMVFFRGIPGFTRFEYETQPPAFVAGSDFIQRDREFLASGMGAVKMAYLSEPDEILPQGQERLARFKARMAVRREYLTALYGRAPTLEEILAPLAAEVQQAMNRGDFDVAGIIFAEEKAS